jgi:hypothetical protein
MDSLQKGESVFCIREVKKKKSDSFGEAICKGALKTGLYSTLLIFCHFFFVSKTYSIRILIVDVVNFLFNV